LVQTKRSKLVGEMRFSAGAVKELTGLTYRQLNTWECKGALSTSRKARAGWRRFDAVEVLALLVCCELRNRFGVSLESLEWIKVRLLKGGAKHLRVALAAPYASNVWLISDLRKRFDVRSKVASYFDEKRQLRQQSACVVLNLNLLGRKLTEQNPQRDPTSTGATASCRVAKRSDFGTRSAAQKLRVDLGSKRVAKTMKRFNKAPGDGRLGRFGVMMKKVTDVNHPK
jgi:DNA-binding transcriptional MerR regulator